MTLAVNLTGTGQPLAGLIVDGEIGIQCPSQPIEELTPQKTPQNSGVKGRIRKFKESGQGKIKGKARLSSKALSAH
jgi:hypothetical protein